MDINTSSPVLCFFQPSSQCRSPCVRVCPAVGYALLLPAVGYALFLACSWLCSFTSCRSALLPAVGPLFYPLWVRSFGFFSSGSSICSFHPVCCLELCSLSPASLFASASVSPHERRAHTVFAVWCLGLSRACVLLLRSSWHSMSRSPWHSMALQCRFPTSCSPVHVLTHVFSFARFFTCCAWLRVVWLYPTPLAPSPPRAARVEGVVFWLVVNSAMPCLWPLLRVAGNTSLLEPVPRRSTSQTANCTSRQALLCLVSRDRPQWSFLPLPALCRKSSHVAALHESALSICVWGDRGSLPWSGFPRFGLRGRLPKKLSHCDSSQLSPLRLTVCLVERALLDADMLELIDRSACLVELVTVESCAPPVLVLSPQQARPAPRPVAAREFPLREALWKVFCSLGCSFRAAPVASLRLLNLTGKSWMIWSLLFCHVVDVMFFLTDLLCFVFLLHNCEGCGRRDPLVRCAVLPFLHGFPSCLQSKPLLLHLL